MSDIFEYIEHIKNEPLSRHTTFKIGGKAKYFFKPANADDISSIIRYCKKNNEKYIVIGNGSNILFPDEGYEGIVIQIFDRMKKVMVEGCRLYAQAGATLAYIAAIAKDNELTGMEFAAGIPGTAGGAAVMNAGAYGGELKDIVEYVDILETTGEVRRYSCKEMQFGYRTSVIDSEKIVLGVGLILKEGNRQDIEQEMDRLRHARFTKQPLDLPSAGSTFKRPEGYYAAKLIEDAGLKGLKHGGAMVSDKHAGFVVNWNNATCRDVLELIDIIRDTVLDKFGVLLIPEVRIIK